MLTDFGPKVTDLPSIFCLTLIWSCKSVAAACRHGASHLGGSVVCDGIIYRAVSHLLSDPGGTFLQPDRALSAYKELQASKALCRYKALYAYKALYICKALHAWKAASAEGLVRMQGFVCMQGLMRPTRPCKAL